MTGITFTIYLAVGYILYYTFNILYDLMKTTERVAGTIETLSVFDEVKTIEVDDYDEESVVTPNNYKGQESNALENNTNKLKSVMEQTKASIEQEEQIIPLKVDAEFSITGGIPLQDFVKQRRMEAFKESNKIPFAS